MDIVADIGGTNMRVAAVRGDALGEMRKVPTPKEPTEGIQTLVHLARECAKDESISALAGGIAADHIDPAGTLRGANNLPAWEGPDIVGMLADGLHATVTLVNDAGAAGLGEAMFGAGRGASDVVYVTISTGVGGAHIVSGAIAEAGGVAETKVDGGDLESLVSGTAVAKRFGIHPKDLSSLEEREKLADTLAGGLHVLFERWSPEVIVLGGSMIVGVNPIPLERVERTLSALLGGGKRPALKMAELGDDGGLWGGIALLKRRSPF